MCIDKREFTDIFVETPSRVHDARVFRICPLYNILSGNNAPRHDSQHVLGDSACPLSPFLMKPYRDNGHLTVQQTTFNRKMSSVRSLIEQTFGKLRCKFRRLKYLEMSKTTLIPLVVTAACVLHNFIIQNDGIIEEMINIDQENINLEDENEYLLDLAPDERRNNNIA